MQKQAIEKEMKDRVAREIVFRWCSVDRGLGLSPVETYQLNCEISGLNLVMGLGNDDVKRHILSYIDLNDFRLYFFRVKPKSPWFSTPCLRSAAFMRFFTDLRRLKLEWGDMKIIDRMILEASNHGKNTIRIFGGELKSYYALHKDSPRLYDKTNIHPYRIHLMEKGYKVTVLSNAIQVVW